MERRQPNLRMAIGAAAAAIGLVLGAELFDALYLGPRVLGAVIGAVTGVILGGFVVPRYNLYSVGWAAVVAAIGAMFGAGLFDALHLGPKALGLGIGALIGVILGGLVVRRYNL